jgi:hypothetical protein
MQLMMHKNLKRGSFPSPFADVLGKNLTSHDLAEDAKENPCKQRTGDIWPFRIKRA